MKSNSPIVAGGQGRDAREIERMWWLWIVLAALALICWPLNKIGCRDDDNGFSAPFAGACPAPGREVPQLGFGFQPSRPVSLPPSGLPPRSAASARRGAVTSSALKPGQVAPPQLGRGLLRTAPAGGVLSVSPAASGVAGRDLTTSAAARQPKARGLTIYASLVRPRPADLFSAKGIIDDAEEQEDLQSLDQGTVGSPNAGEAITLYPQAQTEKAGQSQSAKAIRHKMGQPVVRRQSIDTAKARMSQVQGSELSRPFVVTSYCPCALCTNKRPGDRGYGVTKSGLPVTANGGKICAVDPRVIPLGTYLYIPGYGRALACDTGGAIKGNRIDLYYPTHSEALRFGRKTLTVERIN